MSELAHSRAAEQLAFLQDLQRLLEEGQFVASYKFALLIAIAELCLEGEPGPDGALRLPVRDLAERMIELYWPQVAPFRNSSVLHQNKGRRAAILGHVAAAREARGTLSESKRSRSWGTLVGQVARHVELMPLWRLQVVGSNARTFLYEHRLVYGAIELKPGVAQSFRALNTVVLALVQMAWIRYLHRVPANRAIIGPESDLATFLFGSERNALSALREPLRDFQSGRCFYCGQRTREGGDIDHFIPWSRYSRDLGHNFVLAHGKCNLAKSDMLADVRHLADWVGRNDREGAALGQMFDEARVLHDGPTTKQVAIWAYESTARSRGLVWRVDAEPRTLGPNWRDCFS